MILSNKAIVDTIANGGFSIKNLAGDDPSEPPFNTSAVDLRLGTEVIIPLKKYPINMDLRGGNVARLLLDSSERCLISDAQPYRLRPNQLVLTNTIEVVDFPITGPKCYSARVEGKSSIARCGVLVHFTAPTIHAGFRGTITLEMINLGVYDFLLYPNMYICQLIIEEIEGCPVSAPNQFRNQSAPAGVTESNSGNGSR